MAAARAIGWQEAVARLSGERGRAETAVAVLKRYGDDAAIARGALAYAEAKDQMDAVIAGLKAALAAGKAPNSLPDLEARLARAVEAREAFSGAVAPLIPPAKGTKGEIRDLLGLGDVIGKLIEAVRDLGLRAADDDALRRKSLESALDGAAWRAFTAIPPLD